MKLEVLFHQHTFFPGILNIGFFLSFYIIRLDLIFISVAILFCSLIVQRDFFYSIETKNSNKKLASVF